MVAGRRQVMDSAAVKANASMDSSIARVFNQKILLS